MFTTEQMKELAQKHTHFNGDFNYIDWNGFTRSLNRLVDHLEEEPLAQPLKRAQAARTDQGQGGGSQNPFIEAVRACCGTGRCDKCPLDNLDGKEW